MTDIVPTQSSHKVKSTASVLNPPSLRDLHVASITARFELAKSLADLRNANARIWNAYVKVSFPWTSRRAVAQHIRVAESFMESQETIANFEWEFE